MALSGGAARGAFHLGVLHFCETHGIKINAYSGSSIGAIISCSHASGVSAKEQLNIFKSKEIKQALKFNYFRNGLIKIDKQHNILKDILPFERLEDIPKKVFVNAYDIKKKQLHYFDTGEALSLCIASSALIPLFKPISYEKMLLIDGGLIDNIPIRPLQNMEEKILSIDLLPRKPQTHEKRFAPIKTLKKKIFHQFISNAHYSIQHTDYYLSSNRLLHFKMFTFNELDVCFKFGLHKAEQFFSKL